MAIIIMEFKHIDRCLLLWNNFVLNKEALYKPLTREEFTFKFISTKQKYEIKSFVFEEDGEIFGFSSGVIVKAKKKAYITTVVVEPEYRRKGIGRQLIETFENEVASFYDSVETIDIVFFNPVQFEWIIPNTSQHDHPNSPGVDLLSGAYDFFRSLGYVDFARQNSYYRNIQKYKYSIEILSAINHLKNNDIMIAFYDKRSHHGFKQLFQNLNAPQWENEIIKAINNDLPVLIAEQKGLIIGFTGPLKVQESLRGYFAGIGVHSDYRGYGIGKVLFSSLCLELSKLGAHYMTLFTGVNNSARRIYEKEEFEIVRSWANMRKEVIIVERI